MASPEWATGDPTGPLLPEGIPYSHVPDSLFYFWDPKPDNVPEGGYACAITFHGGGNKTGSGTAGADAVPIIWSQNAAGQYSMQWNAEEFPIAVMAITYPMAISQWVGMGNRARAVTLHNEPTTTIEACMRAVQLAKSRARNNVYPFENVNPDLIFVYGTSAGGTWSGEAVTRKSLSPYFTGERSQVPFMVQTSMAADLNQHIPSVSGTEWMLNGHPRWYGLDQDAIDAVSSDLADYVREDETTDSSKAAAANVGGHASWPNSFRRRLDDDPDSYAGMDILSIYPLNSNSTEAPPWARAHDAGQGVFLHEYLEGESRYLGENRHIANSEATPGVGEADEADALPSDPWAFEWGAGGSQGYQLVWEWIAQRLIDLGFPGSITPAAESGIGGGGGGDIDPDGDALLLQGGDHVVQQDGESGYLLQDGEASGPGVEDDPTADALLLQDGSSYFLTQALDVDGTERHILTQNTNRGTSSTAYCLQDGSFLLRQDGISAILVQDS